MTRGDDARMTPALRRRRDTLNVTESVELRISRRSVYPAEARIVESELLMKRSEAHVVKSMTSHMDK